jgi:glycosyltransferase involved in cell wall biosynthesis
MNKGKKRILFVTSSLNLGGAERQLLLLCEEFASQTDVRIVSLEAHGPLKEKYLQAFPDTLFLNKGNPFVQIHRLRKILKISRPDVVVTWLYKADLLAGIATKLAGGTPVIWSARNSSIPNFSIVKKITLSFFSQFIPKKIIANGVPAYNFHVTLKYPAKKLLIIPNFLAPWTTNTVSKSRLLKENVNMDRLRIGIAARQVSGKGILESIRAIDANLDQLPSIDLTIIGQRTQESIDWQTEGLYGDHKVEEILSDKELAEWFESLDLYLMSSTAWESHPNSLFEAIATGCPVLSSNSIDLGFDLPDYNQYDSSTELNLILAIQKYQIVKTSKINETVNHLKKKICVIYNQESIFEKWLDVVEL